ncbi:MAG TPA: SDR family oxidoreductase [Burkholderiaceae bacterium]|nr:SDR family oxidoreductase [Burkholderiaceae bacterium]
MSRTIFITGCSSGIGAAFAREFNAGGHVVYATARNAGALEDLAARGIRTLCVDVNDDESIAAAVAVVRREQGRIDVLVNNAGFSQVGALMDLAREDLRAQYETNVIAPIAVARAALGLLRTAVKQSGQQAVLANVGSIVGLFATPFAGAYCSSKAAIHSVSETLRMELAPFGIRVVTIQPGGVQSRFGAHAAAAVRLPQDSLYYAAKDGILARAQAGQQKAMPAEQFVRPVVRALLADHPPAVVRGGRNSVRLPLLKRLLPTSVFDATLSARFGLDRLAGR